MPGNGSLRAAVSLFYFILQNSIDNFLFHVKIVNVIDR